MQKDKDHISYPVNLRVLQQELHYLCVASSGCKVQRGAELAVQQVWITVTFLHQQLGRLHFTMPEGNHTDVKFNKTNLSPRK